MVLPVDPARGGGFLGPALCAQRRAGSTKGAAVWHFNFDLAGLYFTSQACRPGHKSRTMRVKRIKRERTERTGCEHWHVTGTVTDMIHCMLDQPE